MIPPDPRDPNATGSLPEPLVPRAADQGAADQVAADEGTAPTAPPAPPPRPGASVFTIEGRAAPGLYLVGWLATLIGVVTIAIAVMSGGAAAPVLLLAGLVVTSIGLVAGAGAQGLERRARGIARYRGPSPVLVFAAAVPLSLLLVVVIGIPIEALGIGVDSPAGRLASVALQACVYIGLIRLLVVDGGALTWAEMGLRRFDLGALRELAAGAVWAAPVILLTIPVAIVIQSVLPVDPVAPLPPTGETSGFLIHLLAGAVIAPIGEEILFRGFATTAWARDLGARRALIRGALFFAIVHVLPISGSTADEAFALALFGFASRIPVALALGWVFLRRGSIWAPIGLHATFNGILLIVGEAAVRSGVA